MNQEEVIKELNEKIEKLKEEKFYLNYKLESERYWKLKMDLKDGIEESLNIGWTKELDSCIDRVLEIVGDYVNDNYDVNLTLYQDQFKYPEVREMYKEDE